MKTNSSLPLACLSGLLLLNPSGASAGTPSATATIIGVPTLGGSGFDIYGVNTNGQVTGFSYLAGGQAAHAFLFSNPVTYDLNTLGGAVSIGYGLNNLGRVVGSSDMESGETHAFYYDGAMHDLGTLGGNYSEAVAINDDGQIVGNSLTANWQNQAFRFAGGASLEPLGDLGGGSSRAVAINQSGTIAGDSRTVSNETHGYLYAKGQMTDIGTLGGSYSSIYALNNANVAVGESSTTNWQYHAFMYADGLLTPLGTLGGSYSAAEGVNDAGQVIGVSTIEGDAETHGFVYQNGSMIDLGTLGGTFTQPNAINNRGHIAGYSGTANNETHAFIWKDGAMTDLNTLLEPDSGWTLITADTITDSGQITGYGEKDGLSQYYVFNPAQENKAPQAVARQDQVVECPSAVTLDGSQSTDPDNDVLTYEWSAAGTVLGTEAKLTIALPLGTNFVSLTVTDPSGVSSTATVKVAVVDTTAPSGSCPGNSFAPADALTGKTLIPDFTALVQATDNCASRDTLTISQSPAAATLAGVGDHTVTITVSDPSKNASTCQVVFTVVDQTAPVITQLPGPQTVSADNQSKGVVPDLRGQVTASDNCYPADQLKVTQSPQPGASLPQGDYQITLTVTDGSGNSTSAQVPLKVLDGIPPKIVSVEASPAVLQPPNHQMVPVSIHVSASDNSGAAPVSRITGVTCDEPLAPGDYQITGPLSLNLIAERSSSGNGRTYLITVECKDSSGNVSQGQAIVFVPKGNAAGTKPEKVVVKP